MKPTITLIALLSLTACGGGGGGSNKDANCDDEIVQMQINYGVIDMDNIGDTSIGNGNHYIIAAYFFEGRGFEFFWGDDYDGCKVVPFQFKAEANKPSQML